MRVASISLPFQSKSAAQAGLGRRLATALIFAAFLLQSFVAQTHMHAGSGTVLNIIHITSKAVGQIPALPGNPDEAASCPLCQAIVHAAAYTPPTVLDMLVRHKQNDSRPIVAVRDMRTDYHGYSKQQRGPPSI